MIASCCSLVGLLPVFGVYGVASWLGQSLRTCCLRISWDLTLGSIGVCTAFTRPAQVSLLSNPLLLRSSHHTRRVAMQVSMVKGRRCIADPPRSAHSSVLVPVYTRAPRAIWREEFGEEMPDGVSDGSWMDVEALSDKAMREEFVSTDYPSRTNPSGRPKYRRHTSKKSSIHVAMSGNIFSLSCALSSVAEKQPQTPVLRGEVDKIRIQGETRGSTRGSRYMDIAGWCRWSLSTKTHLASFATCEEPTSRRILCTNSSVRGQQHPESSPANRHTRRSIST